MDDDDNYNVYWLAVFGVGFLWALSFVVACGYWTIGNISEAGTFGDSFGAINALFSGLAFAGVVIALVIQTKELQLARLERREALESQKEIARQAFFSSLAASANAWAMLAEQQHFREIPSTKIIAIAIKSYEYRSQLQSALDSANGSCESYNHDHSSAALIKSTADNARHILEMASEIENHANSFLRRSDFTVEQFVSTLVSQCHRYLERLTHRPPPTKGHEFNVITRHIGELKSIPASKANVTDEEKQALRRATTLCLNSLKLESLKYIDCFVEYTV